MAGRETDWKEAHYPESRFGGFTDVDGTVSFYLRVQALLRPDAVVVDVGCGRGAWTEDGVAMRRDLRWMRGKCARVIGIDVSEAGRENPSLDEFRALEGESWPLGDASVDLVLADHVLEHVAAPDRFFSECRRVLRAGGHLCVRTPNRWSYIALASRLIPNARHAGVLARVQRGRDEQDVFPTLYRVTPPAASAARWPGSASKAWCARVRRSRPTWRSLGRRTHWAWCTRGWRPPRCGPPCSCSHARADGQATAAGTSAAGTSQPIHFRTQTTP